MAMGIATHALAWFAACLIVGAVLGPERTMGKVLLITAGVAGALCLGAVIVAIVQGVRAENRRGR